MERRNVALVGNNIQYSLSKKYFDKFHKDIRYEIVDTEFLSIALGGFVSQKFLGFNVTTPYKEQIKSYLDDYLSPSVNCVKITKDGKMIGISTDGMAVVNLLKKRGIITEDKCFKNVAILGNGGVTPAIIEALDRYAKSFTIYCRNSRGDGIFSNLISKSIEWLTLYNHDLIINCIPFKAEIDLEILKSRNAIPFTYIDLNYAGPSLNLNYARENPMCIAAIGGLDILYEQAELSYKFWI